MKRAYIAGTILSVLIGLSGINVAMAAEDLNITGGITLKGTGLAAHGYDVVAFFTLGNALKGSDKYAVSHKGGTYRFVSQAHLDAFNKNPAQYVPQYGGYCAYGVGLGKKLDGDPLMWNIVDGKLYFNTNAEINSAWQKDTSGNIKKAEAHWNKIKNKRQNEL